jgi:regulator of protease activity HflC (stomatin/prohibitin superfamily)
MRTSYSLEDRLVNDKELSLTSGWIALVLHLVTLPALVLTATGVPGDRLLLFVVIPGGLIWLITLAGYIINGPNEARVIQLFGSYVGIVRVTGFYWGNPFYTRTFITLRRRTFETGQNSTEEIKDAAGKVVQAASHTRKPSKVNDRDGTPIEIAAVVVWQVIRPADAVFQVEKYEEFVKTQAEAALRNLASQYSYDGRDDERSLRGNTAHIGDELKRELHERLECAGVEVSEARISYLAYAPEIAAAMLQRQQAAAMVAARRLIVDAAVGMVEHALEELNGRGVVELDPERRAAMVSNLMVVLCGHSTPQPVLNAGTLHN